MNKLSELMTKHAVRFALSILVLIIMLLNTSGVLHINVINQIEHFTYDLRLNLMMPRGIDNRIVIIDIDEKSLKEQGRWPWGRNQLATLINQAFDHYHVNTLGFDVVFAEKDESSGLKSLAYIQSHYLSNDAAFAAAITQLKPKLDYDQVFADSLKGRKVVLGYYFTMDNSAQAEPSKSLVLAEPKSDETIDHQATSDSNIGLLPQASFVEGSFKGKNIGFMQAAGYGANLAVLQSNAATAGHFNPAPDNDGITRKIPMLMKYRNDFYESLSSAVARVALGTPKIEAGYAQGLGVSQSYAGLEWLKMARQKIPVDEQLTALIPYRGTQGSFPYVSATDVINGRVPKTTLQNKIVLVGTTAAGLMDLRATPVQSVYAGVEIHANMIAGILDNTIKQRPAYVTGAEFLLLLIIGLLLACLLPLLSPVKATIATIIVGAVVIAINLSTWQQGNLVLPLASVLVMISLLYIINMSYGFFVESRGKRQLAGLFGQYVPPELVDEMANNPDSFSLEGESREMTVLFSDVRGFTTISEGLDPKQLSQLMNEFLTPMTHVIHHNRGTIDKYMGDAIMAFWGAPLPDTQHAKHAMQAAMGMIESLKDLQAKFAAKNWPEIKIGVGLNTGDMTVGNMGSTFRMAYTVMGDAVNLGSRLESLTKNYGVYIIVSEFTKSQVPEYLYRELDIVKVKGKDKPVAIFEPICLVDDVDKATKDELKLYQQALKLYRSQQWDLAEMQLINLQKTNPQRYLYTMYIARIAQMRQQPLAGNWDGVYTHESK